MKISSPVVDLVLALAVCAAPGAVWASEVAADSTKSGEMSVFEQQAEDPYLKRYGHRPGEGWIPVPETRTEIRFNGFIQIDYIHDFQNAGFPYNWFIPGLIPVPTDRTANTEFDARSSRFSFETRTYGEEFGAVKTMFEMDFFGNLSDPSSATSFAPRLRQAYVTWVGPKSHISFIAGLAWTTWVDLEVWPAILDQEGPNAMTGTRQGLLRGSYAFRKTKDLVLDVSLEQPNTFVQDGIGLRELPDLAARVTRRGDWGHVRIAGLARQLVAESDAGTGRASAFGWGVFMSGQLLVPGTIRRDTSSDNPDPRQDSFKFQVEGGKGWGRYVNDLSSTNTPEDAVYDTTTASLEPIPAVGAFVAYQHYWTHRLTSTLVYGVVDVDNLDIDGPDALDRTQYFLVNLGRRVFRRMVVGVEYTWGERRDKDGQKGHANRIQVGLNYGF